MCSSTNILQSSQHCSLWLAPSGVRESSSQWCISAIRSLICMKAVNLGPTILLPNCRAGLYWVLWEAGPSNRDVGLWVSSCPSTVPEPHSIDCAQVMLGPHLHSLHPRQGENRERKWFPLCKFALDTAPYSMGNATSCGTPWALHTALWQYLLVFLAQKVLPADQMFSVGTSHEGYVAFHAAQVMYNPDSAPHIYGATMRHIHVAWIDIAYHSQSHHDTLEVTTFCSVTYGTAQYPRQNTLYAVFQRSLYCSELL